MLSVSILLILIQKKMYFLLKLTLIIKT